MQKNIQNCPTPIVEILIEPAVRLSAAAEAELVEALNEADQHDGILAEELFERLRKYD